MILITYDISDAGFLATAAYDQGTTAQSFLDASGTGWQWVNPGAFGISSLLVDPLGYFNVSVHYLINAQALIAYNGSTHTLAVAFRGTEATVPADFINDFVGGALDFGIIYLAFAGLVSNVLEGATTFSATRRLITGHSLGGAMAKEAMAENLADGRLVRVTFGSPGTGRIGANGPGHDQRLINIGHEGNPVSRLSLHENILGSDILVDLPELGAGILTEHAKLRYRTTADRIVVCV